MLHTSDMPEPGRYQCLVCGTRLDVAAGEPCRHARSATGPGSGTSTRNPG